MTDDNATSSPSNTIDRDDPGDDVQRRFRYQHAYGAILLTGVARGALDYVGIWCEHHDDFLGQTTDGKFDSYQVKTRVADGGSWTLGDESLVKTVKRFVALDGKFPGGIRRFSFASNQPPLDSNAESRVRKSPAALLRAIHSAQSVKDLGDPFSEVLTELAKKCDAEPPAVYAVLRRMDFVQGPGLDSFEAEVAHDHVSRLPSCVGLPAADLNAVRDELIHRIFEASSITVSDSAKHWTGIVKPSERDPRLRAKFLSRDSVAEAVSLARVHPLRFAPAVAPIKLGESSPRLSVLEQKLLHADLADHIETMAWRTRAAEQHFLALTHAEPDRIEELLSQLHAVVRGICDDARVQTQQDGEPGRSMLRQVIDDLKHTARNRPAIVKGEEYECLVGVAGLLTEECEVWWGDEFEIERSQ